MTATVPAASPESAVVEAPRAGGGGAPAAAGSAGSPARRVWRTAAAGVGCYVVVRVLLGIQAAVVAGRRRVPVASLLHPWDGHFYVSAATTGYPAHVHVGVPSTIAFFPLYPLVGRALQLVTRVPVVWCLVAVSWCAGVAMVVIGSQLAAERWGVRRGRQAGILLAVFPGTAVLSMTYADGLGMALALGCLLALERRRHLLAGALGAVAGATLSLLTAPLVAAALVLALARRRLGALLTAALVPAGVLGYFAYLWAHTGSPLTWVRVERHAWGAHLALPWSRGTNFALHAFEHPPVAASTALSLAAVVACLVALLALRAPAHWTAFSVVVILGVLLVAGRHLTPRMVLDSGPAVLALGAALPRWLLPLVAVGCVVGLMLLYPAYIQHDFQLLSP